MKWYHGAQLVLLFAAIYFLLAMASEQKRVELLRVPHYLTDDSPVYFEVHVPRNLANRGLDVAAIDDTGDVVRGSAQDLDADSPALFPIQWDSFDSGTYTVIAQVNGEDGKQLGIDRATIEVLPFRGN